MKLISDVEYIKIWNSANSRQEVADACGISGSAAGMRAIKLRKNGIELKKFTRGRPKNSGVVSEKSSMHSDSE